MTDLNSPADDQLADRGPDLNGAAGGSREGAAARAAATPGPLVDVVEDAAGAEETTRWADDGGPQIAEAVTIEEAEPARSSLQRHPFLALAAVAAAGFVLGRLG